MDITSYLLISLLIFLGFIFGVFLSRVCFEEANDLKKYLKIIKAFIIFLITLIIGLELSHFKYYLLILLVVFSGAVIAYYSFKEYYHYKRFMILTKIFLGVMLFLSTLDDNFYFITVSALLFIYGLLHATIYSWDFCYSNKIPTLKMYNKKKLSRASYKIITDYLIIFFMSASLFILFNFIL